MDGWTETAQFRIVQYKDIKIHYISMTENLINTTYIILGNPGVIHSVPTAFMNGSRLG